MPTFTLLQLAYWRTRDLKSTLTQSSAITKLAESLQDQCKGVWTTPTTDKVESYCTTIHWPPRFRWWQALQIETILSFWSGWWRATPGSPLFERHEPLKLGLYMMINPITGLLPRQFPCCPTACVRFSSVVSIEPIFDHKRGLLFITLFWPSEQPCSAYD